MLYRCVFNESGEFVISFVKAEKCNPKNIFSDTRKFFAKFPWFVKKAQTNSAPLGE